MDSSSVFLGVRIPDLPYKRVCFSDINLQCSLVESGLREMAANQFSLNEKELVFVYRGRPLEGTVKLEEQGVRTGATIHVMRRNGSLPEEDCSSSDQAPLTDDKLREITSAFKRFTASRLWELSHPRVLSRILKQYPAIRDDLGALAILRDPILLSSMKTVENFQEIAKQYPIFLQAAPAIAEILNKLDSTKVARVPEFDDSESSSSSSEDLTSNTSNAPGNNNNNNNSITNNNNVGGGTSRPITQRQLADALAFVGAAFRSAQAGGAASNREPMELSPEVVEPPATVASSSGGQPPVAEAGNVAAADARTQYSQELVQMREMGLIDEEVNLQALQICNGDLEAAINLVFSSSN